MPEAAEPLRVRLPPRVRDVIADVRAQKLSYLTRPALADLARVVRLADREGIPGVLIEAGTARGGSAIVIAAAKRPRRELRVYDVFGMIPPPTEHDGGDVHRRYATIAAGKAVGPGSSAYYGYEDDLRSEVIASFRRFGLPPEQNNVTLGAGHLRRDSRRRSSGGDRPSRRRLVPVHVDLPGTNRAAAVARWPPGDRRLRGLVGLPTCRRRVLQPGHRVHAGAAQPASRGQGRSRALASATYAAQPHSAPAAARLAEQMTTRRPATALRDLVPE